MSLSWYELRNVVSSGQMFFVLLCQIEVLGYSRGLVGEIRRGKGNLEQQIPIVPGLEIRVE